MPNPSELERAEKEQCLVAPMSREDQLKHLETEMQRFDEGDIVPPATSKFEKELEQLINRYSLENGSNTPDFILARFLRMQLDIFDRTIRRREHWYGRTEELVPWMEPTAKQRAELFNRAAPASTGELGERIEQEPTLEAHFRRMQELATQYLTSEPYQGFTPGNQQILVGSAADGKETFIRDMLYMLDGPEQRKVIPNG